MSEAVPALAIVVGPEELLVDRAVNELVSAVVTADAQADVRDVSAAGLEPGTVTQLCSPSLFGDRTVIVLRGVQDAAEALVAELKACIATPAEHVTLVLTHRGGTKGSGVLTAARAAGARDIACPQVKTRRDRSAFVSAEFSRRRRRSTPDAVDTLLDAVGTDLRELAAAVDQLCSDVEGGIDVEVVRRYYEGHAEVTGFTVADRAVEGRAGEALAQLRYALASGTDPVPIVAALAMALRNLVKVASAPRGLSESDLARQVGMPPWKIRVVRGQLRGWEPEGIAAALTAVAEADMAVKGGGADPVHAVERAVVTIARNRERPRGVASRRP